MGININHAAWLKTGLFSLLVLAAFLVPAALAADPPGQDRTNSFSNSPDLNVSGISAANMTVPLEYRKTPAPLTILKVEVTASTLPGPRDMAFGPSTIGFSFDPFTLAVAVIVIACFVLGICVYSQKRNNGK